MFIPAQGASKTDFPLHNASTTFTQTAPRSTEHACCRDAASELLARFWFLHCHDVTSGLTKAGPALLESGLQGLCSCWRVISIGVLKALSSWWEPRGIDGPILDPHSLWPTETAVLNILRKTRGKDAHQASNSQRQCDWKCRL